MIRVSRTLLLPPPPPLILYNRPGASDDEVSISKYFFGHHKTYLLMLKSRSLLSEVHALLYDVRNDQNNLLEIEISCTLHYYFILIQVYIPKHILLFIYFEILLYICTLVHLVLQIKWSIALSSLKQSISLYSIQTSRFEHRIMEYY